MKYCCEKFAAKVERFQFEDVAPLTEEEAPWAINGCCGGGCYVVTGMRYCPYCGTKLQKQHD